MGDVISLEDYRDAARIKAIREHLPEDDGLRWIARRKAAVVAAIDCGAISFDEARERYALSEEELSCWRESIVEKRQIGSARDVLQHYRNTHGAQ